AGGITTVAGRTACFLVCHCLAPYSWSALGAAFLAGAFFAGFSAAVSASPSVFLLAFFGAALASVASAAAAFLVVFLAGAASVTDSVAAVLAAALVVGLAPPVRISVIRTVESSWRWPLRRRELWRRRFLKTMTVFDFLVSTSSAATSAPSTSGAPMVSPTISTWSKVTMSPASASSFSILMTSLAATLYCFPPVLITAKVMFLPIGFP